MISKCKLNLRVAGGEESGRAEVNDELWKCATAKGKLFYEPTTHYPRTHHGLRRVQKESARNPERAARRGKSSEACNAKEKAPQCQGSTVNPSAAFPNTSHSPFLFLRAEAEAFLREPGEGFSVGRPFFPFSLRRQRQKISTHITLRSRTFPARLA